MREGEHTIYALLTHPYFWPHVTRGAEREVHGVGSRLAARGHRVRLVTGQPTGFTSHTRMDGIDVRYVRTPLPAALAKRGWRREGAFLAPAAIAASLSRADIVVSYYYADLVGATVLRRRPAVLKLTGAVPRDRVDSQPVERRLLRRALDEATEVWVNSRYVADTMTGWGRQMHVVPAGVDVDMFRPVAPSVDDVLVVCTAAPAEPRKRLIDLLDAWPGVIDALPGARLLLVQQHDRVTREALLDRLPTDVRGTVEFDGPYDQERLARLYSRATVTVAPAVHEALGLATLESLACGTPVVGARSGATPELLQRPGTGVLFEPGSPESLAEAVTRAVSLAQQAVTRDRCRAAALAYAWGSIIDIYEQRLGALVARADAG